MTMREKELLQTIIHVCSNARQELSRSPNRNFICERNIAVIHEDAKNQLLELNQIEKSAQLSFDFEEHGTVLINVGKIGNRQYRRCRLFGSQTAEETRQKCVTRIFE